VPGQRGAWGYDPVPPQVPGQQPGQGAGHGAVSPVRPWGDLPPEDRDLVPQHEDLRILGGVIPG
jgi:hypothetical protein